MIKAQFYKKNNKFTGFSLSGHAGLAESGKDIACAAVSSAAELVCNTVTDIFCDNAQVTVSDNMLTLKAEKNLGEYSEKLIRSFFIHLGFIAEEFPGHIRITEKEEQPHI